MATKPKKEVDPNEGIVIPREELIKTRCVYFPFPFSLAGALTQSEW